MSSPTQRSLAKLRSDGWPLVQVTERWNQFARVRQDLFGFIDCLAIRGDVALAVQTTSGANVSARLEKMETLPSVVHWLSSPSRRIVIHGWAKRGDRGKRKLWTCREVEIVLNETGKPVMKEASFVDNSMLAADSQPDNLKPVCNYDQLVGEIPLKQWCTDEALRTGKTPDAIYHRFARGSYPWMQVRRVNKRVVFVKP